MRSLTKMFLVIFSCIEEMCSH